jgi:hypothetical protein
MTSRRRRGLQIHAELWEFGPAVLLPHSTELVLSVNVPQSTVKGRGHGCSHRGREGSLASSRVTGPTYLRLSNPHQRCFPRLEQIRGQG